MVGAEDEKSGKSLVPLRTVPVGLNPESRSDFGHSKGQVTCCGGQWDSVPVEKEVSRWLEQQFWAV